MVHQGAIVVARLRLLVLALSPRAPNHEFCCFDEYNVIVSAIHLQLLSSVIGLDANLGVARARAIVVAVRNLTTSYQSQVSKKNSLPISRMSAAVPVLRIHN